MLCIPFLVFSARIGIIHFKASPMEQSTADAVTTLLAGELANYGYSVVNPDGMDAAVEETIKCYAKECAAEYGFKAGVERVIYGSVSKLGEKYIVQASVVNVATREVLWSGSMAAKSAEELDVVVKRLAWSIHKGKKVEAGAQVGKITEQEVTQGGKRRKAFFATGGSFDYGFPMGGYGGASQLIGGTWINWYETPDFFITFNFPYYWSLNADLYNNTEPGVLDYGVEMGFYYAFSKGDFSPFVGGGLGPHFMMLRAGNYRTRANFGMTFFGGGGIVMLRTYDFHVFTEGRYMMNIAQLSGFQGPHHGFMFRLGLVYRTRRRGCGGGCGGGGCF